jgi:hypothetical protein
MKWRTSDESVCALSALLPIGAFTIGGGVVMIGVIEAELRATKLLSDDEIADMIVLATAVPGPMETNLAWLAGGRLPRKDGVARGASPARLSRFSEPRSRRSDDPFALGLSCALSWSPWTVAFFRGASVGVVVTVGWPCCDHAPRRHGMGGHRGYATTVFLLLGLRIHPFAALMAGTAVCALCLFASVARSSWERS